MPAVRVSRPTSGASRIQSVEVRVRRAMVAMVGERCYRHEVFHILYIKYIILHTKQENVVYFREKLQWVLMHRVINCRLRKIEIVSN